MKQTITATREQLAAAFPLCFKPKREAKLPLKIGIHRDIRERQPELPMRRLRRALADYTSGPTYLAALVEGAPRIDLDGNAVGVVTAAEAATAAAHLAPIIKDRASRLRHAMQEEMDAG